MFSDGEKLAAIEREIRFRKRVYARRVEAGTMTCKAMSDGIAIMEDIAADYRAKVAKGDLFGGVG